LRWEERYPPWWGLYVGIALLMWFAATMGLFEHASAFTISVFFAAGFVWSGKAVRTWRRRPRNPRVAP
jgi:hypothetical protein